MTYTPSRPKAYLYYLSFVLIFATVAFVASMYLMGYEDKWDSRSNETMWAWSTMETKYKIAYATFLVLQFPFGLLFGLITGVFNNGIFACIINPLFYAWILQMIFKRTRESHINRTVRINYSIWAVMMLTIVVYIWKE